MDAKTPIDRIVFGLKLRQLRQDRGFSVAELAERAGMSVSYLSEIEKGKKFPKEDKIDGLVKVLGTRKGYLLSLKLPKQYAPLEQLLRSQFLTELPLEALGIEMTKVVESIANAPAKIGAFISTLIELSRNSSLQEEDFYIGALRAYKELHSNYFEDVEHAVKVFVKKHAIEEANLLSFSELVRILKEEYDIQVVEEGLAAYPELDELRALMHPHRRQLLLSGRLSNRQKIFQCAKELGFRVLDLKDRAYQSKLLRGSQFERSLNHYLASYFSVALIIDEQCFVKDLESFFSLPKWDPEFLLKLLEKYNASPEMLFQRLSNILPKYFDIDQLFILRIIGNGGDQEKYVLNDEMHFNRKFRSYNRGSGEHYCRRWISIQSIKQLRNLDARFGAAIARAHKMTIVGTEETYFSFALARAAYPNPQSDTSISLGILLSKKAQERIAFLNDPDLPAIDVGSTCERCPILDCNERAHSPTILNAKLRQKRIMEAVRRVLGEE